MSPYQNNKQQKYQIQTKWPNAYCSDDVNGIYGHHSSTKPILYRQNSVLSLDVAGDW